jgi:hypothetical protein
MRRAASLSAIAACAIAAVVHFSPAAGPPATPTGTAVLAAFERGADRGAARTHAAELAEISAAAADVLEFDWQAERSRIRTGQHVHDLRLAIRDYRLAGWSFLKAYPALQDVLDTHFSGHVGRASGPLTNEQRTKWISAFRELAEAARYAESRL